jgi:hypothetical protein
VALPGAVSMLHGSVSVALPQWQGTRVSTLQAGQGPLWQLRGQGCEQVGRCRPQLRLHCWQGVLPGPEVAWHLCSTTRGIKAGKFGLSTLLISHLSC